MSEGLAAPSFEAWKAFVVDGILLEDRVRPIIARSWQRCRAAGLDPWTAASKPRFGELDGKRAESRDLLFATGPIMRLAMALLNVNISVSDRSGYVLDLLSPLKYYPRSLAAYYSETQEGTSCIALAMVENIPVRVDTYEHYAISAHSYSGVSSPVLKPDDQPAGYLHAVNPFEPLPAGTLALISAAARLAADRLEGGPRLSHGSTERFFQAMIEACCQDVVVLDRDGVVKAASRGFEKAVGHGADRLAGTRIDTLLADPQDLEQLVGAGARTLDGARLTFKDRHGDQARGFCQAELIRADRVEEDLVLIFDTQNNQTELRKIYRPAAVTEDDTGGIFAACNGIGHSPAWQALKSVVSKIAPFPTNVLLQGESGSGKEVVARVIHAMSRRRGRYVGINCGAIPKELLYSELFGYEEGAFTGARKGGGMGKFEYAHGGTLFLDEIGEMPPPMQVALLRAIQEKTITRFGSNESRQVDVRIIAATNRDMHELVRRGIFREDLYYRIAVADVMLPALRDRREDIPLLAAHWAAELCLQYNLPPVTIEEDALQALCGYGWPGNVRELKNVIEKALIMASANRITVRALPACVLAQNGRDSLREEMPCSDLSSHERRLIVEALGRHNGNIAGCARELKISRGTLYRKLKKYRIECHTTAVAGTPGRIGKNGV